MIMTSHSQSSSFLNPNPNTNTSINPNPNTNPLPNQPQSQSQSSPKHLNSAPPLTPSSTTPNNIQQQMQQIQLAQQQMVQQQQQRQQQLFNAQRRYIAQQTTQRLISQHQIPPHPQQFNLINMNNMLSNAMGMNTMNRIISPNTTSIPSPIPNTANTHSQSHSHSHTPRAHQQHSSNPYQQHMTSHQYHTHMHSDATGTPSVTSLGSFASSLPSINTQSIINNMNNMNTSTFADKNNNNNMNNVFNNGAYNNQNNNQNKNNNNNNTNNNNNNNNKQNNNKNNDNNNQNSNNNDKNGGDGGDDDAKYPSAVLGQPPNSLIVNVSSNNKYGLRNYLVRARRILRLAKTCRICGIGSAVSVACEVTEVLKREKVAEIKQIITGLIVDDDDDMNDGNGWQQPRNERPSVEIIVKRGKYAHLVSDFRRRKVIEVFEKKDKGISGFLAIDFVRTLDLPSKFKADPYRTHQAQRFLQNLQSSGAKDNAKAVNLPEFIHYCSIIIHPLLLEYHFKMAIAELGGYVDVHDGHLPREHSEEKILQLQQLGRIPPFLSPNDDVEFDPVNFKTWFPDRYHHINNHQHQNQNKPQQQSQLQQQPQQPQQQQQQQQQIINSMNNMNMNVSQVSNMAVAPQSNQSQQQSSTTNTVNKPEPPQYPNPLQHTTNVANKTIVRNPYTTYDDDNNNTVTTVTTKQPVSVITTTQSDDIITTAADHGSVNTSNIQQSTIITSNISSAQIPSTKPQQQLPQPSTTSTANNNNDNNDNNDDNNNNQDVRNNNYDDDINKEIQHNDVGQVATGDDADVDVFATSDVSKTTTVITLNENDQ